MSTVLSNDDKTTLKEYRNQGAHKLDIIGFLGCDVLKRYYQYLPSFLIDIVDHPSDDIDAERFYRYLAIINSNQLTRSMGSEMKALRLLTLWNSNVVMRNLGMNVN